MMSIVLTLSVLLSSAHSYYVVFQPPVATPTMPPSAPLPPAPMPTPPPATVATPRTKPTDAEQIANTRDAIQKAMAACQKLQTQLDDPEGEYSKAEAEFEALNTKLKDTKAEIAKLRGEGKEQEASVLETELPTIQEDWQLAKERFDIAIRQKKASTEAIASLKERIAADQKLLAKLEGKPDPTAAPTVGPMPPIAEQPGSLVGPPAPTDPATTQETPTAKPSESPNPAKAAPATGASRTLEAAEKPAPAAPATAAPIALPGMPTLPTATAAAPTPGPDTPATPEPTPEETDPEIVRARTRLDARRAELNEAEARLRLADERVRVMERSVQNAEKFQQLEGESVIQAEKAAERLSNTLSTQPPQNAAERDAMAARLTETLQRLSDSKDRVQRIQERLITLNESLKTQQAERDLVAKEVEEKHQRLVEADAELRTLLDPASPRNIVRWVLAKGPRILFIVLGMTIVHLIVRQFSRHIVQFIARHSDRGSQEDRENRASTLVGVFRYVGGIMVFGGGLVMLLDEIGVPIVPLMGGAAVLGLAVAFGAQNLIRDYFTGFMMLMEDQYSVNDVVRIGTIAGQVEQISLRMTVLRDLEGVRHFIPHGTITSVSNLTHGWSRALFDVPVAYKENVDRVIEVLMELARQMRLDPIHGHHIIDNAEMLGVDQFGNSAVVIKFLIKTRPLKQWPIKRELLRRIKNKFDELGIEIPFPHQTVYHRFPENKALQEMGEQLQWKSRSA